MFFQLRRSVIVEKYKRVKSPKKMKDLERTKKGSSSLLLFGTTKMA